MRGVSAASVITLFLALIAHVQATPLPRSNDFLVLRVPRHVQVGGIGTTPFGSSIGHSIRSNDPLAFDSSILSARGEPTDLTTHLEALKTEAERLLQAKQVVELNRKLSEVRGFYPNPLAHHGDSADDKHKPLYSKDVQARAKTIYEDLVVKLDDRVKKKEIIRIMPDVEPPKDFKIQRTSTLEWSYNFKVSPQEILPKHVVDKILAQPSGYTAQSLIDVGEEYLAEAPVDSFNHERYIIVRWQLIMLAGEIVRRSGREEEFEDLLNKLEVAYSEDAGLDPGTKESLEFIHEHYRVRLLSVARLMQHHPASRR